jgi:hypothetical protein
VIVRVSGSVVDCNKPRLLYIWLAQKAFLRSFIRRIGINGDQAEIEYTCPISASGRQAKADKKANKFQFDGHTWTLQYEGKVVFEKSRLGLFYIALLIQRGGGEIHVTKMITKAHGEEVDVFNEPELLEGDVAVGGQDENDDENPGGYVVTTEFRDEILSDEDRGFVLDLLEKAEVELVRLKIRGWPEPIKQQELIIEQIKDYLRKTRFMGHNVCFAGRAEPDRKSVAKAINQAIAKIAKKHPALAEHLRKPTIKTGEYCSYKPTPDVHWEVAIA